MADFLYGKLNKTIEYLRYKFEPTETAIITEDDQHNLKIDIKTDNLVKLLQIPYDSNPADDNIKHYQLFARNNETGLFDIPLGDKIIVGEGSKIESNIKSIVINGIPIEGYIDDKTGQFNLSALPATVITDVSHIDASGKEVYIESVLDGNAGGKVY